MGRQPHSCQPVALLSYLHTEPPDGWRYLQKETGLWIRAELFDELVVLVVNHRLHKGLEPTDKATVELEIQRQICLGAAPGVCHAEKGEGYVPFKDMARTLSLVKIAAFSDTLVSWLKAGAAFISEKESLERAAVCRGCPFNRPAPNCVCTTFYALIDALIPAGRNLDGLYVCGLCGCALKAKALAPLSVVREGNPENLRLPDWCWQK